MMVARYRPVGVTSGVQRTAQCTDFGTKAYHHMVHWSCSNCHLGVSRWTADLRPVTGFMMTVRTCSTSSPTSSPGSAVDSDRGSDDLEVTHRRGEKKSSVVRRPPAVAGAPMG